jgi:hypothetical protein
MSFVSNIVGGILGAGAAHDAANAGVQGAQQAQNLELKNQQAAQDAANTSLGNITAAQQPYQQLGKASANNLQNLLGQGFQAPTLAQAEQTPGYQFNLQQGTRAIAENAAATGNLMSGNTGTALENYGQGLAQNTYQQAYNNALNTYMANYQSLLGGTGAGLNSTGQLTGANLTTAGQLANIDLTGGAQQAQQINNAAAARAQGYLGQAAGWGQMAGGIMQGAGALVGGINNLDYGGTSSFGEQLGNFYNGMGQ